MKQTEQMRVLVLQGGNSSEREVSLRSAQSVIQALHDLNHFVTTYDPILGMDGLSDYVDRVDVVFPVLHGAQGEDGSVQAALERIGLPYVGADSGVSALCFDKSLFRLEAAKLGYTVPPGQLVDQDSVTKSKLMEQPFVLKPVNGGSSIDTIICKDPTQFNIEKLGLFERHSQMLLEKLVDGTEITVPVLLDEPLPVIEILPPSGEVFDYDNKYNGATQENCPPLTIDLPTQAEAQEIAVEIHTRLGVRHFSRTDMIVDREGKIYVLELNTIPGLTSESLFPKSAAVAGISMTELVHKLIEAAAEKSGSGGS